MSDGVREGWHPDPFGRHAERFHDGARWMPYVRDGDTHGLDAPDEIGSAAGLPAPPAPPTTTPYAAPPAPLHGGPEPVHLDTGARPILGEPVLVLRERGAGVADVLDTDGVALGALRTLRTRREVSVELVGPLGAVLSVRSTDRRGALLAVSDGRGVDLGRIEVLEAKTFRQVSLVGSDGLLVGTLVDTRVTDLFGRDVATVSVPALGGSTTRHLTLDAPAEPLRSLALAALVAVEPRPAAGSRRQRR